jgi:hypothetical protein
LGIAGDLGDLALIIRFLVISLWRLPPSVLVAKSGNLCSANIGLDPRRRLGSPRRSPAPPSLDLAGAKRSSRAVSLVAAPDGSVVDRKRCGRKGSRFTKPDGREALLRLAYDQIVVS